MPSINQINAYSSIVQVGLRSVDILSAKISLEVIEVFKSDRCREA